MASEYDEIVNRLVLANSVEVVVHQSRARTLIAMVKKIKSERNRMRKKCGFVTIPKMNFQQVDIGNSRVRVTFKLTHPIVF